MNIYIIKILVMYKFNDNVEHKYPPLNYIKNKSPNMSHIYLHTYLFNG